MYISVATQTHYYIIHYYYKYELLFSMTSLVISECDLDGQCCQTTEMFEWLTKGICTYPVSSTSRICTMCVSVRDCVKCVDVALSGIRCLLTLHDIASGQLVTMTARHAMQDSQSDTSTSTSCSCCSSCRSKSNGLKHSVNSQLQSQLIRQFYWHRFVALFHQAF